MSGDDSRNQDAVVSHRVTLKHDGRNETMPWFDLSLADLKTYRTAPQEPEAPDDRWAGRLFEADNAARRRAVTRHRSTTYGVNGRGKWRSLVELSGAKRSNYLA